MSETLGVSKTPRVWVAAAARNNAVWCDTVCRAHGRPGEFLPGLWLNRHQAPRFYPNAVTLAASSDEAAAGPAAGPSASPLERIRDLGRAGLPKGWGVKDSFRALDLAPLGFRVLFDAEWIWRPVDMPPPGTGFARFPWARVRSASELAAWETACGATPEEDRLFPPLLLDDPAVAFLAAQRDGEIVAGAIAYHSGDAVGLSNFFGPEDQAADTFAWAVVMAGQVFPGLPLVGYESGADLAAAQEAGFTTIGPLRVWVSDGSWL